MARPTTSPDLTSLVDFDPISPQARNLVALARLFLNPKPSQRNVVHDASSLLAGVEHIQKQLHLEKVSAELL